MKKKTKLYLFFGSYFIFLCVMACIDWQGALIGTFLGGSSYFVWQRLVRWLMQEDDENEKQNQ